MNEANSPAPRACEDDDLPPPPNNACEVSAEVKPKPILPSIDTAEFLFIFFGSLCILLGVIDMIVFYVVPNNKISKNKKQYPDYEFVKPDLSIVIIHFLTHVSLIAVGCLILSSVNYNFFLSTAWIVLLCIVPSILLTFYILEVVFSACYLHFIKKEDFSKTQIFEHLNSPHPINIFFFYIKGRARGYKGHYYTCYSKNGFSIPVQTNRLLPDFYLNEYNLDYFYFNITQKVNMSDQLFQYINEIKLKISSCESKFSTELDYYPLIEGKNLILSEGKKIPAKMKKRDAIASLIFGLGVYPELLEKSIPIKSIEQNIYADIISDFNYSEEIAKISCSALGKCLTKNKMPHY